MLTLHYHPLASYCWKVLIALYEGATPFTGNIVDLSKTAHRDALKKLWPPCKFPVIHDDTRDRVVAESSTIIEYLARHAPGAKGLLPDDNAHEVRAVDRFFDGHVHEHMQKIVDDKLRAVESRDTLGVDRAHERLATAYDMIEARMSDRVWAVGQSFTMADCAASPALYYATRVAPLGKGRPHTTAYLQRLVERPAFARVLVEAAPYFHHLPG